MLAAVRAGMFVVKVKPVIVPPLRKVKLLKLNPLKPAAKKWLISLEV
jgi:hypothetical protein